MDAPIVGENEHCGGFIQHAPICAPGLVCQRIRGRPADLPGICRPPPTDGVDDNLFP
jgi:hypothetical protein